MTGVIAEAPTPLLQARDLSAVVEGDAGPFRVLDAVSLDVAAGEIVDITGPSGAGKTTLVLALAWLLPGTTGELALEGVPATKLTPQRWRAAVALLPQKPAIVKGTLKDNLLLPWTLKVRAAEKPPAESQLLAQLAAVGLPELALERDAARLSVGQQARIALSRVLLTAPRALLLDEPDAALDDASADAVACIAREFAAEGGAVVRVRHRSSDGLAARRLRLEAGRLSEVAS
jgi:putative ABC transport system ATP-binding protein